jgi:hypothetical protein
MKPLTTALAFVLAACGLARADLIAPGTQNIPVHHKITTEKDQADWSFYILKGSGVLDKAVLDSKTPLTIAGNAAIGNGPVPRPGEKRMIPYRSTLLIAIPREEAKKYASEKELNDAVKEGKVEGLVRAKDSFPDHVNARMNDKRKAITLKFRLVKVDPKEGIVLEEIKEKERGDAPEPEEEVTAAPPSYPWIATGLASAALIGFGGTWLTRRSRRS